MSMISVMNYHDQVSLTVDKILRELTIRILAGRRVLQLEHSSRPMRAESVGKHRASPKGNGSFDSGSSTRAASRRPGGVRP